MRLIRTIIAGFALLLPGLFIIPSIRACTFVSMAKNGIALVGYNEDFSDLRTKIWFIRSSSNAFGRMIWGYDRPVFPYQGGMNDRGLFVDFNATDHTGWKKDPDKPDLTGDETDFLLSHFATVDEVIDFFNRYNVDLGYGMFVVADAVGNSAVLGWADNQLQVVRKKKDYQIAVNFTQAAGTNPEVFNDYRYTVADQVLRNGKEPTVDLIRRTLSATHFETIGNATLYSVICDLVNRKVNVYHFHNYEDTVVFNLDEELAKGDAGHPIPSLFAVRPFNEMLFRGGNQQQGGEILTSVIDRNGIKNLNADFNDLKNRQRTFNRYLFPDWIIRGVGQYYQQNNKLEEAIAVFRLNVQEYPDSWEVYSDLADACLINGDTQVAKEMYQKALEKNPGDTHIREILTELDKKDR